MKLKIYGCIIAIVLSGLIWSCENDSDYPWDDSDPLANPVNIPYHFEFSADDVRIDSEEQTFSISVRDGLLDPPEISEGKWYRGQWVFNDILLDGDTIRSVDWTVKRNALGDSLYLTEKASLYEVSNFGLTTADGLTLERTVCDGEFPTIVISLPRNNTSKARTLEFRIVMLTGIFYNYRHFYDWNPDLGWASHISFTSQPIRITQAAE